MWMTSKVECPESFLGIKIGDTIESDVDPISETDKYLGFNFVPDDKFLDFDQYKLHATLRTRTVFSVAAGALSCSRDDADSLAYRAMRDLEHIYKIGFESIYLSDKSSRDMWVMIFRENTFFGNGSVCGYFLVEVNSPEDGFYLTMVSFHKPEYSDLETEEARNFRGKKTVYGRKDKQHIKMDKYKLIELIRDGKLD